MNVPDVEEIRSVVRKYRNTQIPQSMSLIPSTRRLHLMSEDGGSLPLELLDIEEKRRLQYGRPY